MTLKLSELEDNVEISVEESSIVYTVAELKSEILEFKEPHHQKSNWSTISRRRWEPSAEYMIDCYIENESHDMYEDWDERANDCIQKAGAVKKIQAILDKAFKDAYATAYWTYEKPVIIDIFPSKYLVTWKDGVKGFDDIHEATKFAEDKGLNEGIDTYVYGVEEGQRNEEPFARYEWTM